MIDVTNDGAHCLKLQIESVTEDETIETITTKAHGGEMTIAEARTATVPEVAPRAARQVDKVTAETGIDSVVNAGNGLLIQRTKIAGDADTAVTDTETTVIETEIVTPRNLQEEIEVHDLDPDLRGDQTAHRHYNAAVHFLLNRTPSQMR